MGATESTLETPSRVPDTHKELVGTWACTFAKRMVVISFEPDGTFEQCIFKTRASGNMLLNRVRGHVSEFADDCLEVSRHRVPFSHPSRDAIVLQGSEFKRVALCWH
eukprot:m51a1_g14809 hypothetical protein (107) ;mRNA; r:598299-598822